MKELNILYVVKDRSEFNLMKMNLLQFAGANLVKVTQAQTTEHATKLIRNATTPIYDAIMADCEFFRSGRENDFTERIKRLDSAAIIALTDAPEPPEIMGAAHFCFLKSIYQDSLVQSILRAIEWKRSQSELGRLHSQLKESQMSLIQSEKLASLGRIASGVAHEVKNPLASLQMGVSFLKDNPSPKMKEITILEMEKAIDRACKIVKEMVDFSGDSQLELKPTNLNDLVKRSARLMRHEFSHTKTQLIENLATDLAPANADADKIEQVILNMVANGIQSMGNGGAIEIRTANVDEAIEKFEESDASVGTLGEGSHVAIEIRDYGGGISESIVHHVFDAFFTTKSKGVGTGLGLFVAGNIIKLHNGSIKIYNEYEPRGLRIRLVLPTAKLRKAKKNESIMCPFCREDLKQIHKLTEDDK